MDRQHVGKLHAWHGLTWVEYEATLNGYIWLSSYKKDLHTIVHLYSKRVHIIVWGRISDILEEPMKIKLGQRHVKHVICQCMGIAYPLSIVFMVWHLSGSTKCTMKLSQEHQLIRCTEIEYISRWITISDLRLVIQFGKD